MSTEHNPFAPLLADVPRYGFDMPMMFQADVLAALAAAVPADLAEAGGEVSEFTKNADIWHGYADAPTCPTFSRGDARYWSERYAKAADLITALLARIAAQEAQIKGLKAERNAAIRREETAWREANHANAKVRGWEATVVVRNLPQLAIPVTGWGPGEGEQTAIPHITPERLTDILDKLDAAETALAAMTKERDELAAQIAKGTRYE